MKGINPYSIYRSPIGGSDKSGQNWNMIASAGEFFLGQVFGKQDYAFVDNSLALQGRHFKGIQGVYAEGPVTYDIKPRVFWLDALLNGYSGQYAEKLMLLLKRGAITSLMIQSPDGSLVPGGRSGNHAWGDSLQCALFEMMSSIYHKEGNSVLEQKYSSAASLALSSVSRYIQPSGDLYTVKNRSDVSQRHGFESYTSCSHYNLLAAAMLSTAYLYSEKNVEQTPLISPPALSGTHVIDLSKELGRIIATYNGTQVVFDVGRNHKQNPTGIIRALSACSDYGLYDGTLENASYVQPGNTLSSSLCIGYEDSKGKVNYLSQLSDSKFQAVKLLTKDVSKELLKLEIQYITVSGIEFIEIVEIKHSSISIRYRSNKDSLKLHLQAPIICSDGFNIINVENIGKNKIASGRVGIDYYTLEFIGCNSLVENPSVVSHRSGYASIFESDVIDSDNVGFEIEFKGVNS
uniref:Uncharacterized protein n=1 Tax=Vibrio alginolyticus TaxID=663 RepID=A0A0N6WZL3_VIBAL|nr:Hypothetical protein ICEValHN437_065 [Vibrio alginolyticus]